MEPLSEKDTTAAAEQTTSPAELLDIAKRAEFDDIGLYAHEIFNALAANRSTPIEALSLIANLYDPDGLHTEAKSTAIDNPNIDKAALRSLMAQGFSPFSNPTLSELMATHRVSMKVATLGFLEDFTAQQYDEFRDAPAEWVEQALQQD